MKKLLMSAILCSGVFYMYAKETPKQTVTIAPELLKNPLKVRYTNWRGETSIRTIVPLEVYFGNTEYHPEEQWLLKVWDVERSAERIYAFKEIKEILS